MGQDWLRVVLEPESAKVNRSAEYSRTVDSFHCERCLKRDRYVSIVQECTVPLTCTCKAYSRDAFPEQNPVTSPLCYKAGEALADASVGPSQSTKCFYWQKESAR